MVNAKFSDLEFRLQRLESSDFAKNRADYEKTMESLRTDNPGVNLWP
jgi:hypothetical protein